ncbi:hypothetical protein GCM10025791_12690 [Halioxenophilus aromaticivorans]|uniref:Sulfotransferase n=2 Tax=Halioxenophilus aromaticivorans TaxID=1306992 RepID=A0AAV3TZY6_9ALTE
MGNEKGFYENTVIREQMIKKLLLHLGCDPLGVKSLPLYERVPNVSGLDEAVLQCIHKQGYSGDHPWLYKDAKLTLLWPIIAQAFPRARWIIVRREPTSIIASCMRTHFMAHHSQSKEFWQDFVRQYQQRLQGLQSSACKVFEICADSLIRGNSDELLLLAESLELSANASAVSQFISPELWRANTPA